VQPHAVLSLDCSQGPRKPSIQSSTSGMSTRDE
jgi:hypothetical protein